MNPDPKLTKLFPVIKFKNAKPGQFLMDMSLTHAFEIVMASSVMKKYIVDAPIMRCYKSDPKTAEYKPGQIIADYFENDFYLMPKETIDRCFE